MNDILVNGQLCRHAIRYLTMLAVAAGLAIAATAAPHPAHAARLAHADSYRGPHFATPQAAMRFLAAAYNHHNAPELHWVTTPASYARLKGMRSEAVNLQLRYCTLNRRRGDYTCHFRHDYPPSLHKTGHGAATFIAAPALTPGWYMYTFVGCG